MALLVAVGLHAALAAWIFIKPAISVVAEEKDIPVLFYRPPPPPPPPPPAAATHVNKVRHHKKVKHETIVQPKVEEIKPVEVEPEPEPDPEPEPEEVPDEDPIEEVEGGVVGGVEGGVIGGTVGGQIGGVIGGVLGGELGSQTPVRLKHGMTKPEPIAGTDVAPVYPRMLREARFEGRVLLKIVVRSDGSVGEVKVMSGHPALAQAAVAAVKKWRWKPAMSEGRPITIYFLKKFEFKLNG